MDKLKEIFSIKKRFEIKNFREYFKKHTIQLNDNDKRRIFFVDSATYNNMGDQAISYAITEFIKTVAPKDVHIEISEKDFLRNFNYIKKNIKNDDIICLSGGGNMGDLYPRYEAIRRKVITHFMNNKIIIFPQTIDYRDSKYGEKELRNSIRVYNSNPNLLICAREEKSFNIMKKLYKNVILVPDIALILARKVKIDTKPKNVIGICLRNDKESVISDGIMQKIDFVDSKKVKLSTLSNLKYIAPEFRRKELLNKIEEFAQCNLIITDRLHGMIFAIIARRKCIAFDNSNKKVSGVYNTIKKYVNNICVSNEENFEKDLKNMIDKEYKEDCLSWKMYDSLKENFILMK